MMASIQVRRCIGTAATILLALLAGCRNCSEPSCIDQHLGNVAFPVDPSPGPGASPPLQSEGRYDAPSSMIRAVAWSQPIAWVQAESQQEHGTPNRLPQTDHNLGNMVPGREPLRLPTELPGADAPPLRLPPLGNDPQAADRRTAIRQLYPALPMPAQDTQRTPGPDGRPFTLADMQAFAWEFNPQIRVAAGAVEVARGLAIQSSAYPNPHVGYQADTVGTADSAGYHGGFIEQKIVTGGKLQLARAAAEMELANAELGLRSTRYEIATNVRSKYFEVLVALERLKLAHTVVKFTDDIFQAQVALVEGGEAAPYEPLQLRVLALQARAGLVQSQQEYLAAWRELAATIGIPDMPPTDLAGQADSPVPAIDYEQALAYLLANHTELMIAQNEIAKADFEWQLACVTPRPDIDVGVVVQRDYTFLPNTTTYNLVVGGEIPVFNRNRGNIIASQASMYRASHDLDRVRNKLMGELAGTFARYQSSRILADTYRLEALREQVRTYRGVYDRYRADPGSISFADVLVAQQNLVGTVVQYVNVLGDQWQAVIEVAGLLQIDDLFQIGERTAVMPIPNLEAEVAPQPLPPQP